jgi:hypothetical protein
VISVLALNRCFQIGSTLYPLPKTFSDPSFNAIHIQRRGRPEVGLHPALEERFVKKIGTSPLGM